MGFFLRRYWDRRDASQRHALEAESRRLERDWQQRDADRAARDSQRETLVESLKWFEGDTQKRSIGISLVTANWESFPELHRTWLGILANQAVYILSVSGQGSKPHEITNLKRIMAVLAQDAGQSPPQIDGIARRSLRESLDERMGREEGETGPGVEVAREDLVQWWQDLGFKSWR